MIPKIPLIYGKYGAVMILKDFAVSSTWFIKLELSSYFRALVEFVKIRTVVSLQLFTEKHGCDCVQKSEANCLGKSMVIAWQLSGIGANQIQFYLKIL